VIGVPPRLEVLIRFCDADRKWRNVPTGYDVGQEELAAAMHDEFLRRVAAAAGEGALGAGAQVDAAPLSRYEAARQGQAVRLGRR
jgi:hypothetical protein